MIYNNTHWLQYHTHGDHKNSVATINQNKSMHVQLVLHRGKILTIQPFGLRSNITNGTPVSRSVQLTVPSEDEAYIVPSLSVLNLEEEGWTPSTANWKSDSIKQVLKNILLDVVNYAGVYGIVNCLLMQLAIVPDSNLPFLLKTAQKKRPAVSKD